MKCQIKGCKLPPNPDTELCGFHAELVEIARENMEEAEKLLPPKEHCPWCLKCRAVMAAYSYRPGYVNYECPNKCRFRKPPPEKKKLAEVIPIRRASA